MKLYRFLNPQGNGLYQDEFYRTVGLGYLGEEIPYHQPPMQEDVRKIDWTNLPKYHCAFESMEQLVLWFRWNNPLDIFIHGGSLIEVEVPEEYIRMGRMQCIFHTDYVKAKRIIDIDEFVDLIAPIVEQKNEYLNW